MIPSSHFMDTADNISKSSKATMVSIGGGGKKPVSITTTTAPMQPSSSSSDEGRDGDVSRWVLNEVAKADALQVISFLSATTNTNTPASSTTQPKQQKFPFLPDSLEVVLMDVFSTTVKRQSSSDSTATTATVSDSKSGEDTHHQPQFCFSKFPEGFVDMLSFKRCSDGKRVYSALLCTTIHQPYDISSASIVSDILNNSCITPKNYPASPDANTIVISGGGDGGIALQGRPQPPPSRRSLSEGGANDEWIPVQLLGSERLLGNELPPTVLGQLTTYRAQHRAWNSQMWQVAHFSTVGGAAASPSPTAQPIVYSGWVHRQDYDQACTDAGITDVNSSQVSTAVVQLNNFGGPVEGGTDAPLNTHTPSTVSTSGHQPPPNLPACNIALPLPIMVGTSSLSSSTGGGGRTIHIPVYMSIFNFEHLPQSKDSSTTKQPSTVITSCMD